MAFMGDLKFCCESKRRLLTNNALFNTLKISPAYLIFNKFQRCKTFKKIVKITNEHTHERILTFENNFPCGLSTLCLGEVKLLPEESICVDVYFEPTTSRKEVTGENSRFSLLVCSDHPKMAIEIPVIIELTTPKINYPSQIRMPDTSPNVHCYYAFPVYNPTTCVVCFNIRTKGKLQNLRYMPCQCEAPAKGFCTIFLEAKSENMCPVLVELELRFSNNIKKRIKVEAQMVPYMLHVSDKIVRFPITQLGMRSDEGILLCNESEETIKFKWCRQESKDCPSPYECIPEDQSSHPYIKQINEYFQIRPKSGLYSPISSESALISFNPPEKLENESQRPPFEFEANAYLACSSDRTRRIKITLIGQAQGATVEIIPNEADVGTVFVGERVCRDITVTNTGNIGANLHFDGTDPDAGFGGVANASPGESVIESLQSERIVITYCAKSVGKFVEKLFFQVKFGERITFLLKGCAVPISITTSPKKIDFGDVAFGVLRKKYLTITNSLKIPVVITASIINDGEDDPLFLEIDEKKLQDEIAEDDDEAKSYSSYAFSETESNHYTFWQYNSRTQCGLSLGYECFHEVSNEREIPVQSSESTWLEQLVRCSYRCEEENEVVENVSRFEKQEGSKSNLSNCICETSSSTPSEIKSNDFNEVLDNASLIAVNLVTKMKENKILEDPEPKVKVIEALLDEMYTFEYFQERKIEDVNYKKKAWSGIPSNPREVFVQTRPIYIEPRKSTDILVYLVPNKGGPFTRHIDIRLTPFADNFDMNGSFEICSRALSMSVPVSYNCVIPIIYITEEIIEVKTYVDFKQHFSFRVKSLSPVDGFFFLNIIPKNKDVELLVKPRKFCLKAEAWRKIHGRVTVFKVGEIILNGTICVLGCARPTLYKVIVNAKPPRIEIKPKIVSVTQRVLKEVKTKVYITNICPTKARILLSLEDEDFISIEPKGGILGSGQCILITLKSLFYDCGSYKNTLVVNVIHFGLIKVPLKYTVQGLPFEFNPNIRNNFNLGTVFTSQKPYITELIITNHGRKSYKLFISKMKSQAKNPIDSAGFQITPHMFIFNEQEIKTATISIKSTNKVEIENEFSVDGAQGNDNKKFHDFNFTCSASFVRSLLKWNKDEIIFDIRNSELCEKKRSSERVSLSNNSKLASNVEITVVGSFTLLDPCKKIYGDKFNFSLQPKESRDFEVFFDMKYQSGEKLSRLYDGKVVTISENRLQKCLLLTARMLYPAVEIDEEELYYFARKQEFFTFFKISNPGLLAAIYKWKLIEETEEPVDYVSTRKMRQQKNISQELFSRPSSNMLQRLPDIDEEYLESLSKFIEIFEESECESETETETTETTDDSKRNRKTNTPKKKQTLQKTKAKSKKSGSSSKETLKNIKKKTSRRKSGRKSKNSSKTLESTASTSWSSIVIEAKSFITDPLNLVEPKELAEELGQFLKDNFARADPEDLCEKLAPSENIEECHRPSKHLFLDHYKGFIRSENCRLMNLFFSGHDRDVAHRAKYELEVAAGNTTIVDVVVYNINATIEVSETKFDFGYQPWYKVHQRKIKLCNRNDLNFKIAIVENAYLEKYHKLDMGFVSVNPHGVFYLLHGMICELTVKVYMGFSSRFRDGFGIEINNNAPIPVIFTGKAGIPMLTILNAEKLFKSLDRTLMYRFLNKMFLSEVSHIEVHEVESRKEELCKLHKRLEMFADDFSSDVTLEDLHCAEEASEEMSENSFRETFPKLKDLYIGEGGRVLKFKNTKTAHRGVVISKLDLEVEDYHVCDYPEEYPHMLDIENMIETNRFLQSVNTSQDIETAFRTIGNKHVLETLKTDFDRHRKKTEPIQIRSFIVHPLPFNTTTYNLSFGSIRLNEELLVPLELFFHGPGRAVFSARTSIAIPGLEIEFCGPEPDSYSDSAMNLGNTRKFIIYNTKPVVLPGFKYLNAMERHIYNEEMKGTCGCEKCAECENCEIKVCRAHSYDFDLNKVHTRDVPNRKLVVEYYNKWNQHYKEEKDPFVLSEIFQEDCKSADETMFILKIKFIPTDEFYREDTHFIDYIFIDVHLGPTIPILLSGDIKRSDSTPEDISSPISSEDSGVVDSK